MSAPKSHPLNGDYDQSLLAATPEVSRAAKQESYNVDLLDQPPPRRTPTRGMTDPEAQYPKESYTNLNSINRQPAPARLPWYKTRGGMIGLAIVAIVIIGAVVGGAVGGTVGHGHSNVSTQNSTSQNTGNQSTTGQQQGAPPPPGMTNSTDASKADDGSHDFFI